MVHNSYIMPTKAVRDLLLEPKGGNNKSHAAQGGVVKLFLKPTIATHLHYYSNASRIDVTRPQP